MIWDKWGGYRIFCNAMSFLWDTGYSYYFQVHLECVSVNFHFSWPPGALDTASDWPTVCLGEIAVSQGRLVLLLLIQIDLQCFLPEITISLGHLVLLLTIKINLYCVLVNLPSLYVTWYSCHWIRLTYSVSQWNRHLSVIWYACYAFRMIYSVSQWNPSPSSSSGTLPTHSEWSTVCLGEPPPSL